MSVEIKGYVLVNDAKVKRAYHKELGVGPDATEEQVLEQYAKFGGLIKKGSQVVKVKGKADRVEGGEVVDNGLFWDFANNRPVKKAKEEVEEEPKEVKEVKKPVKKAK